MELRVKEKVVRAAARSKNGYISSSSDEDDDDVDSITFSAGPFLFTHVDLSLNSSVVSFTTSKKHVCALQ